MYRDKIIKIFLLLSSVQLIIQICCNGHTLNCGFYCCYYKYKYESTRNANDNCKLKCHLLSLSGVIYNITSNYSVPKDFSGLSDNSTLKALDKCISQCPEVQHSSYIFRCNDDCCKDYNLPGERRSNDPKACCDSLNMTDIKTVDRSSVIDCMVSNSTCDSKGYNLLLKGNKTVCATLDSISKPLGADFGFDGGCPGLYGKGNYSNNNGFGEKMVEYYLRNI